MTPNRVKFSSQIKPDFIIELREKVKEYFEKNQISKYGNANMVLKSIFMMTLYFGPYLLMLTGLIDSIPGIIISWAVMGIGMTGVGMVLMHDANHGSYSKNQKINKFLSKSMYLLGGYPAAWRQQHNTQHHGFTNIEGHDEDIDQIGLLRFSPHKPLKKVHQFQYLYAWFFYGLSTLSWVTIKDFKKLRLYKKTNVTIVNNKSHNRLMVELIFSKILYHIVFLVLPLVFIAISWYWIVLCFLMMHFIAGVLLSAIFQTAHIMPDSTFPLPDEKGNLENSWAVHQLLTTTDYSPKSRVFSWMIGGLNYQIEHHLFPNISHVHYRHIAVLVQSTARKHNVPYYVHSNFFLALVNHVKMLKSLGKE